MPAASSTTIAGAAGPRSKRDGVNCAEILVALRRSWAVVVICVGLGFGIGYGIRRLQSVAFRSTETAYLVEVHPKFLAPQLVKAYADASATTWVLTTVPHPLTRSQAAQLIHNPTAVLVPPGTNLVTFSVTGPTGVAAARNAQAVGAAFQAFVQRASRSAVRAMIVQPAEVSADPIAPRTARTVVVGLLVGLFVGVFLVVRRLR